MKSGLTKAIVVKTVRTLLLLAWLLLYKAIPVVWGQLPENNLYLNNEIKFERIGIEQGLRSNTVTKVTQDRKGFMWFATQEGLCKFDGYTVTVYQNNPRDSNSLSDNNVTYIYEDRDGLLWVGLGGGGVNTFNPQIGKWQRYLHNPLHANSMSKGLVHSILEDKFGIFWFGTTGSGITSFDRKTGKFTHYENDPKDNESLSHNMAYQLLEDKAGKLWIVTGDGLNLFDRGTNRFKHFMHVNNDSLSPKIGYIHGIYENREGLLWLSSTAGVHVFDPKAEKFLFPYYNYPYRSDTLRGANVGAPVQDQDGNYWLGTEYGLGRFNPLSGKFTVFAHKDYLPKKEHGEHGIHDILVDRSGMVWISTIGRGILYFSPHPRNFRRYLNEANSSFGPENNLVQAIFQGQDGHTYVATRRKLLKLNVDTGEITLVYQPETTNDYAFNLITSACEEKQGVYWLGTDKDGVIRFDSRSGKEVFFRQDSLVQKGLAANKIDALFKDRSGTIWVGMAGGLMQWYDSTNRTFSEVTYQTEKEKAFKFAGIRFIYEDKQGSLWIAVKAGFFQTEGDGLYQVNRRSGIIKHYSHNENLKFSLSSDAVTCLYEDEKGIFWIGTYGQGLNKLNPKTGEVTIFTQKEGLQSNTIQAISGDNTGNIWILNNEGVTRLNATTLQTKWYNMSDGLGGSLLGGSFTGVQRVEGVSAKKADGTILFGNNNGVIAFHPQKFKINNTPPPVAITDFKVFDKSVHLTSKEIMLNHDQNFFEFNFAALSFLSASKNQYAYRLEELEKDWVYNGTRREARYTNMSPGKYIFRVKGSNNDGIWNEQGTSLTIIIHPPWWRTPWAYTLYVIAFAAGMWAFIEYRSRSLKRENRLLEEKVELRTTEVVAQKEELQSTLEHLKATQAQLIQKEKAELEHELELEKMKQEQELAAYQSRIVEMEMQALRAQMNPHFIFNCLNSINRFILKNESEAASDYLTKFSKLIRLILQNSQSKAVPLESELEALRLYMEMEMLRFEGQFTYNISLDPDLEVEDLEVPPLIIQPYVENAIWHGLMHKQDKGHLIVELHRENGTLYCQITDDGVGRKRAAELKSKSASKNKSLGMKITSHRLELINTLSDKDTTVEVIDLVDCSGDACGTRVVLKIPV